MTNQTSDIGDVFHSSCAVPMEISSRSSRMHADRSDVFGLEGFKVLAPYMNRLHPYAICASWRN
ncbi:hypothetical protein F2Q68_00021419 [Brassica cretica]|uniref:Uncharacterized protein n=2 Tax=Brassica cretica TaxID=69181 RepID=A0A8S9FN03_BRACR|nr:hypothetical protein F2Q68_00021419 [Brassica cretica]KAF3562680.1 hypothetical protein DY000_02016649 [Brassica cretica]